MKKIILLGFVLTIGFMHAQVGIGTPIPSSSSQLDIVSDNKGVLIPRLSLTGSTDDSTILEGNIESLLVFNTNTVLNDISPGYYYWNNNKWQRIVNKDDLDNVVNNDSDILTNNGAGTFTHTAADGTAVDFDITQKGIGNPNSNGTLGAPGNIYIDESTGLVWTFSGTVWVNQEPWFGTDDNMAATENTEDIYSLGRVGIGTMQPNEKLEVHGKVRITDLTGLDSDKSTNPDLIVTADDVTGELKSIPISTFDADLRLVGTNNHITKDAGVDSNGTNAGSGSGRNTAIGPDALSSITTGFDNIAIGFNTLSSVTDARNNIALGWNALSSYISGPLNIGIGNSSLRYHVTGAENIAMGFASLENHLDGQSNLSIGNKSFRSLTNGDDNIALGVSAGDNLITGSRNLILGTKIDLPDPNASNQLNIGNIIYGVNIDGTGTLLSTGYLGIGTVAPNNKLEIDSNVSDESGLRLSQINATSTTVQQAGTLGIDNDGDIVPVMRNETVFVGKVTDGAVIGSGYVRIPMDAVYDPLGQWDGVNHIWLLPNDGYVYEYHVSLNRNDIGTGVFTHYRPNSATIIPLPTNTGQYFSYSYSGIASLSGGLGNHYNGIPLVLNNNSGSAVTLSGIAISRGYWTLTIKRLGKI